MLSRHLILLASVFAADHCSVAVQSMALEGVQAAFGPTTGPSSVSLDICLIIERVGSARSSTLSHRAGSSVSAGQRQALYECCCGVRHQVPAADIQASVGTCRRFQCSSCGCWPWIRCSRGSFCTRNFGPSHGMSSCHCALPLRT